jgi:hypothetical protein
VAPTSKAEMQANNTIFYQLLQATINSQVYGLIKQFSPSVGVDKLSKLADGRLAWQALMSEFNFTDNIAAMKHVVEAELLALRCTDQDSIVQYICDFNSVYTELNELSHVFDSDTLYHKFTDCILATRYDLDLQWEARRQRASLAAYSLRTAHATPKSNPNPSQGNSNEKDSKTAAPKSAAANQKAPSPKSTTDSNGDVTFETGFQLSRKDAEEISQTQREITKDTPNLPAAMEIYTKWRTRTHESSYSNNANSGSSSSPAVSETTSTPAATQTSTSAVSIRVHFADNVKLTPSVYPSIPVKSFKEPKTVEGVQKHYKIVGGDIPTNNLRAKIHIHHFTSPEEKDKIIKNYLICSYDSYLLKALGQVGKIGENLRYNSTPSKSVWDPESCDSEILPSEERNRLIEIGIRLMTIGRVDIVYAISTLNLYSAIPSQFHFDDAVCVLRYLNSYRTRGIMVRGGDFDIGTVDGKSKILKCLDMPKYCPDAGDDWNAEWAEPKSNPVNITIFVDASHATNHQGSIATSDYGEEQVAVQTSAEEATAMFHTLKSIGVNSPNPVITSVDYVGAYTFALFPGSVLKTNNNIVHVLTKPLGRATVENLLSTFMFGFTKGVYLNDSDKTKQEE